MICQMSVSMSASASIVDVDFVDIVGIVNVRWVCKCVV